MATFTLSVQAKSHTPPTANAGSDRSVNLPISTTTLNGSGSVAGDGTIVSYSWSQLAGPSCSITNPASVSTAVTGMTTPGSYTFQLVVTDNNGLTGSDTVAITINALIVYPFKWVGSAPDCVLSGAGYNTGNALYATLLKVSNDINTYPLDVNNHKTADTGLSQASKANSSMDADFIPAFSSPISCPPPSDNFVLSPAFAMEIVSVTGGSDIPADLATANASSGTYLSTFVADIAAQDLTVTLSGSLPPTGTYKLDLYVDGVQKDCQVITTGGGPYTLTLPATVLATSIITIAVDSGACI